jgi:hypothetical protein
MSSTKEAKSDQMVQAGVNRLTSLFGDDKSLRFAIRRIVPGTRTTRRRVASLKTGVMHTSSTTSSSTTPSSSTDTHTLS